MKPSVRLIVLLVAVVCGLGAVRAALASDPPRLPPFDIGSVEKVNDFSIVHATLLEQGVELDVAPQCSFFVHERVVCFEEAGRILIASDRRTGVALGDEGYGSRTSAGDRPTTSGIMNVIMPPDGSTMLASGICDADRMTIPPGAKLDASEALEHFRVERLPRLPIPCYYYYRNDWGYDWSEDVLSVPVEPETDVLTYRTAWELLKKQYRYSGRWSYDSRNALLDDEKCGGVVVWSREDDGVLTVRELLCKLFEADAAVWGADRPTVGYHVVQIQNRTQPLNGRANSWKVFEFRPIPYRERAP